MKEKQRNVDMKLSKAKMKEKLNKVKEKLNEIKEELTVVVIVNKIVLDTGGCIAYVYT